MGGWMDGWMEVGIFIFLSTFILTLLKSCSVHLVLGVTIFMNNKLDHEQIIPFQ